MGKFDIIQWTKKSTTSLRDKQPVTACFGLYPKVYSTDKLIYKAVIVGDDFETPEIGVLKARRYRPGTERFWQGELDLNRYAHQVATTFTNQTLAGRIEIVDQYLSPIHRHKTWDKMCLKMKPKYFRQLTKFEMVLVEEVVRDLKAFKNDKVLEAFSHYSYSESNGENLLYAFRGNRTKEGRYLLLTPEMLTHKYDIHKWFQKHTCNEICGRFRRPPECSYPEIKPSNTDIQSDKSFYNFKNDLQPPNYYDEMPRDGPNAPNAPNAPHETGPPKQNNLETTFGAKSCDGSHSVVTAVVHSDSIGKNKRPIALVKESSIRRQDNTVKETAISNDTYNLVPVPMDSPREDEDVGCTARPNVSTDDVHEMPFDREIMPKSENRLEKYDVVVESSTLVARPSSTDFDTTKQINLNNIVVVGVDEANLQQNTPLEEDTVDGPDYMNAPDGYQTMIIHHDRDDIKGAPEVIPDGQSQNDSLSGNDEVDEGPKTEMSDEVENSEETEKPCNVDLPIEETVVLQCGENPLPSQEISNDKQNNLDDDKRHEHDIAIKDVESPVYININAIGTDSKNDSPYFKYTQPVAEVVPSPVLMSPSFKEPRNEDSLSDDAEKEPKSIGMTNEESTTPPDSGLRDDRETWFSLETFQKQFVLPEKVGTSNDFPKQINPDTDVSQEQNETIEVIEQCDEPDIKGNEKKKAFDLPVIVIDDVSDENEHENHDDVDSSYASNSDSLDDSNDAVVLDENDKIKVTNLDKVIPTNECDSNPEENSMDENNDFLTKYNLQSFVDGGDNDVNSQTYKITDYKLISDYIQILPEETETQDSIPSEEQRPLHSSLKSGKHKQKGRSVKFVEDLHDDKYIRFYKRKDMVNNLNSTPYTNNQILVAVELHPQTNPSDLPISHDRPGDPNWYSTIPCECCIDNDSGTGRD